MPATVYLTDTLSPGTKCREECLSLQLAALYLKNERLVAMLPFALYYIGLLGLTFFQDSIGSDFGGLGRKLLGGFAAAVVVAIALTVIKLRLRDKQPVAKFISITSCTEEDTTPES
jgi:hypothetical protein